MNKVAIAAVIIGGLINSAQAEMYFGGKVGITTLDDACYLNRHCDDSNLGFGMNIGYKFTDIISLEYGVDYLDDYEANFKSGDSTIATIEGDLWALTFAPKFNWHLNDTWNLFAKIGGAYIISGDERDFVPTGSVGAEYTINRHLSFRAEYQRYQGISDNIFNDMDANFFGLGVNYKFAATPVVTAVVPVVTATPKEEELVMITKTHKEVYGAGTFELNSSKLSTPVSKRLDSFVNFLNENPSARVEITGYTDSSGTAAYNQKLSEQRAQTVANYLIEAGIDADRATVIGLGEESPVADNSTREGREKNRRIEIFVPEFQYKVLSQAE